MPEVADSDAPAFTVKLAPNEKFAVAETACAVFEIVRLFNVKVEPPPKVWLPVPLKVRLHTLPPDLKVTVPLFVKLPPTDSVWVTPPPLVGTRKVAPLETVALPVMVTVLAVPSN